MNKGGADRQEQKFFLNYGEYSALRYKLKRVLDKDDHGVNGVYTVTSLYFDDVYNRALAEKIRGDTVRHKYRIRYYNDNTAFLKLERKSKYQRTVVKSSVLLTEDEVRKIYDNNHAFLLEKGSEVADELYLELAGGILKPKVVVKYKRLAFVHPVGNLRITFDTEIKTSGHQTDIFDTDIHYLPAIGSNMRIMELKFSGVIPDFIRSLLQIDHVMASAASKYVLSRRFHYEY